MAVLPPSWATLKTNIVTILKAIATEETLISASRNFIVKKDDWSPTVEAQQKIPLVNVMVQNVGPNSARSANKKSKMDEVTVNIDMYAFGKGGEILPADELAAERLDLLVAQVREGLTRLDTIDLGFSKDPSNGFIMDWDVSLNLTYYDQENEQATRQYAPARWSFSVNMPFIPNDERVYNNLEELNVTLEQYALRFTYTP